MSRKSRLTRFELELMEQFWNLGPSSVREIQESLPERSRPAYTTVQTMIYRLEEKKAVRRIKKIGNAHVFAPVLTRQAAYGRLIEQVLDWFGGSASPLMAHLINAGKLTLADLREAEQTLVRTMEKKN